MQHAFADCGHDGFHSWWLRIVRPAQRLDTERVCDACGEVLERRSGDRYVPRFNPHGKPDDLPPSG
jgi:hypothetical protein